ncbi:MAG: PVC-type heme-binding CxxCH protein, partial [Verrucomicrobiota bacterium]
MISRFLLTLTFAISPLLVIANPLHYEGHRSMRKDKHLVFIASDHEYRTEETLPMLARILAEQHGFDCTVLFGLDENGEIKPGASNIPGTEVLADADGLIISTRFLNLPAEQMQPIVDYLDRAGPVVGLRTATHGFRIPEDSPFARFDFRFEGEDYKNGFGEQVLGQTWVGHYGKNRVQSNRITIIEEKAEHPILRGVSDIHTQAGGYNAEPHDDWDILTMAQPLMTMEPDGELDATKPPEASEWTRTYVGKDGATGRVFTSLYGASLDIVNPGYRRLLINGIYWSIGLEDLIKPNLPIELVGDFHPTIFKNGGHVKGIKPSDYASLDSPIPAKPAETAKSANAPGKKPETSPATPKPASGKHPSPWLESEGGSKARYVRVHIKGENRTLTLAEVEVFAGAENIAPGGKASQSATAHSGKAERAIDGNRDPDYNAGGQTHTPTNGTDPWWELDLGEEKSITSLSIWNRGERFGSRLDGFGLQLLDADRDVVFEKITLTAPTSAIHILIDKKNRIAYTNADGSEGKEGDWKSDRDARTELSARPTVAVPDEYADPQPFAFAKGDTFALIGNALAERFQHEGHLEAALHSRLPDLQLAVRNMGLAGDRVGKYPRSKGFTPKDAYLQHVGADVIGCFFGYNESFDEAPGDYTSTFVDYVKTLRSYQPNGESFPRIILFSPIAHEDLEDPNLPDGSANNTRLALYTEATRNAAEQAGVAFVDLFSASQRLYRESEAALTINGIHLNPEGQRLVSDVIASALAPDSTAQDPATYEAIRSVVVDKNWHWFNRYRAVDGNDIWGGRSGLKFVNDQTNAEVLQHELVMLDVMTANRDEAIWAKAQGRPHTISDGNVPPPVPVISNVGGGSKSSNAAKEGSLEYLSGEEGIGKMTVPEGFEVNLFASEDMFPEMINPVQMQVDTQGRLWAAVWPTYPKWEPLKEMRDALVILEDTDGDGVADECKEFARVHNPLGFEFWNGGVLVTSQPDLIFLKDTDGDDVADHREVILNGFGSSDTHHTANNLIYGPDGHIYWQSGVFLVHNHEHPWGPSLNTGNSAMYRWDPRRYTIALHANNSPNPHGIAFDEWGYHYANDGTGGRSYQVRPEGEGFAMQKLLEKEVRPVAANAIVSSSHFPEEMQGNFLVANTIGFLGLKNYRLHRDGFTRTEKQQTKNKETGEVTNREVTVEHAVGEVWGTPEEDLLVSTDGNFRPTDAVFGEDGALYVSDWCNVIIGHMQHNIRDPNRDKLHGRVYRVTYPSRPLQDPVSIDGEPEAVLMSNLEHPVDGVRHRTRVELSERDTKLVIASADQWIASLDPKDPAHARHLLEALWVHQQHNVRNRELLDTVLSSPNEHVRIAAATVRHHWDVADPALGVQEIEEQ